MFQGMHNAAITLFGGASLLISAQEMTQKSNFAIYSQHGRTWELSLFQRRLKRCTSVLTDEVSRPVTGFVIPEVVTSLFGGVLTLSARVWRSLLELNLQWGRRGRGTPSG